MMQALFGAKEPSSAVSTGTATVEPHLYYIHTDHLGTPQELTDRDGLQWIGQYRAWGELAKANDSEGNTANVEMPLRFQGQYFDAETGLHYNRFRYYDPQMGRFTTQDPISLAGGINLYQYAPNPVQWVDPFGLAKKQEDCPVGMVRVRHYTNRKGSNAIEESGVIRAQDNNRVYVEPAKNKPLSRQDAEDKYQIGRGKGRDYVETNVPENSLEWVNNPRYHTDELTVKGDVELNSPSFTRRK